jgi:hypothetical protein
MSTTITYTIHKLYDLYELRSVSSNHIITIKEDHSKYLWVQKNEGRVVNVNEKGHMNSSADRQGYYKTSTPTKKVNISLTKLDDLNIDDSLFIPMVTGTIFDKFCSTEGGFLPGTNTLSFGAPGVGKCVRGNSMITVRNKKTGGIQRISIRQFHNNLR